MTRLVLMLGAALTLAACNPDALSAPDPIAGIGAGAAAKPGGGETATDPTATWIIPPLGEGQHLGVDGSGNAYTHGSCGVNAKIFATDEASGSGDAILHTSNPKFRDRRCSRKLRFSIAGTDYELDAFINVRQLHQPGSGLAEGQSAQRTMSLNPDGGPCARLLFDGMNGSALVQVERTTATSWIVRTAEGGATAWCEGANVPVELPFQLTIIASYAP